MSNKNCCCIDHVCFKLGSSLGPNSQSIVNMSGDNTNLGSGLDEAGCAARGGTVVDNCHECE